MTTPRTPSRPGGHARSMQRASQARAAKWALPIPVLGVLELPTLAGHHWPLAAALAAAAAVCWLSAKHHWTRSQQQRRGAQTEESVAKTLSSVGAHHVINSADLGVRGDADHVVLHPRGLAVVETKNGGGRVRVVNGQVVTGKGAIVPRDPIGQVRTQAAALARISGRQVTRIVCVRWMRNDPFLHGDVIFCGEDQLAGVLRRMTDQLTEREADRLRARIVGAGR